MQQKVVTSNGRMVTHITIGEIRTKPSFISKYNLRTRLRSAELMRGHQIIYFTNTKYAARYQKDVEVTSSSSTQ